MLDLVKIIAGSSNRRTGLRKVLITYGMPPIASEPWQGEVVLLVEDGGIDNSREVKELCGRGGNVIWICPDTSALHDFGLSAHALEGPAIVAPPRHVRKRKDVPSPIARFGARRIGSGFAFEGNALMPLLVNEEGQCEAGTTRQGKGSICWVGINIVDEIVRYRQGDPRVRATDIPYDLQENTCQRSWSHYSSGLDRKRLLIPEADIWGWLLASWVWDFLPEPKALLWPIPEAQRIVSLVTMDGDEARKEQFVKVTQCLSRHNATALYFMTPNSANDRSWDPATLAGDAEFGIHPVIYTNNSGEYEHNFDEQTNWFKMRFGYPPWAVRNHMFFQRGYLDMEEFWQKKQCQINFNIPGLAEFKSTFFPAVLNGSFQPFSYRRSDGSWLEHEGMLTAYDDNFLLLRGFSYAKKLLNELLALMSRYFPGILVSAFHPHNADKNIRQIKHYLGTLKNKKILLIKCSEWFDYVEARKQVVVHLCGDELVLEVPKAIRGASIVLANSASFQPDESNFAWSNSNLDYGYFRNAGKNVLVARGILKGHCYVGRFLR